MWPHHQYNYKGLLKVHCNGVGVRIGRRMQILRWTRVCCFATDWDAGCTNSVCGGDEDLLFPVEGGGHLLAQDEKMPLLREETLGGLESA